MSNPHAAQLDRAKRVVNNVMKTRGAYQLFNVPVDPVALNLVDYFDVITDPIDLGTIHKRLIDGQKNDWDVKSYYHDAQAVYEDVSRVWINCYTYNNGPNDAMIREVCRKTQHHFETKWREAGLLKKREKCSIELSNEAQVPEVFSARKETMELPVRLLDAFCILSSDGTEAYVRLEDITAENIDDFYATGKLVPHDHQGLTNTQRLTPPPPRNDTRDYGDLPGIWLVTKHAWYKLLRPAEAYGPYLSGALQSFMMSLYFINFDDSDELKSDARRLSLNGTEPELPMEIVDILMEDATIKEQTEILMKKRQRSKTMTENGSYSLSDSDSSSFSQAIDDDTDVVVKKGSVNAHRSLRSGKTSGQSTSTKSDPQTNTSTKAMMRDKATHRKKQRMRSPPPPRSDALVSISEMDEDDPLFDPYYDVVVNDEEDEDYVNEAERRQRSKKTGESEAQRLKRQKKEMELLRREHQGDRDRGDPPVPETRFRLPQEWVGLSLSCWDFLMTFHIKLELPPLSFRRFEAVICPMSIDFSCSASETVVQDNEARASALLLQDIHLALYRVLQGRTTFSKDTSTHATMDTKSTSNIHWTQSVSLFLLKSSIEDVDDEARTIATFLHGHEYLDLTVRAKLKILYTLINMVISTDVFREHLNSLVDKLSVQKAQPYEEKPLNVAILESVSLSFDRRASKLSAKKWSDWFLAHRVGALSTIGSDFRGTHYWVLGDVAGCYQIYVEYRSAYEHLMLKGEKSATIGRDLCKEENAVYWGWYEGEAIAEFTDWLKRGGLESEKTLLETIMHIPKPIQLERQRPHVDNSTLNIISLGYHKMDPATMDVYRMDGYAEIRYPLLRGEGEITEQTSDVHLSTRINACVRALLAAIPFWEKDSRSIASIGSVLDRISCPLENSRLSKEIVSAMELISQYGTMGSDWKEIQEQWEISLNNSPSMHSIAAHLAVLQSFVRSPAHSVHRPAFNIMVHDAKCPLYFPMPGESVVVLRTGCLAHLDRYLELSRQTLAAPNTASCFQKSRHPEFVSRARAQAENLTPVEYFRVCCIAYRSPYPDAPPEGVELARDESLPVQSCMWLLLTPAHSIASNTATAPLTLPIHVDNALPDFIVKVSAYEQTRRTNWKQGDRFKMFFGGKSQTRGSSGIYYKGTISSVKQTVTGEAYDPWESMTVEWDNDHSGASMKVSPWEIEVDPEEQKKLEDARLRQMESRARQARALAKQHRNEYLADMIDADDQQSVGDPDYDPTVDFEGGKSSGRSRRRGSALQELVYYDPKNPSGPVPPEMMALLPGPYEFPILIHNFMQRLKGKFKCPVFSGKDLDLYKVFYEVQNRGGYEVVTNVKLWKDVCRTLNVNLKGQTSASYNMRLNYEKCLLDFEHYLASGRYRQELEDGTAPSYTVYEPFPQKLRGFDMEAGSCLTKPSSTAAESEHMVTRGTRRSRHGVSMTQLLMGEPPMSDWKHSAPQQHFPRTATSRRRSESERVIYAGKSHRLAASSTASVPLVTQGTHSEFDGIRKIQNSNKDHVEIQPGESIGMALDRMGWALLGCYVWCRWPRSGTWCKAEATKFDRGKNLYCLSIDKDLDTEQTEWFDLRELESEELSQHNPVPCAPVSEQRQQKSTVKAAPPSTATERSELSQLLAPPRALQRYGADTPKETITSLSAAAQSGMDPMEFLNQVLRSGMNPEFLQQIVDDASLKQIREEASRDHLASLPSQSRLSQTPVAEQLASLLSEGIRHKTTTTRPMLTQPKADQQSARFAGSSSQGEDRLSSDSGGLC